MFFLRPRIVIRRGARNIGGSDSAVPGSGHRALAGGVGASIATAGRCGVVARRTRPDAAVSGSARRASVIAARRGVGRVSGVSGVGGVSGPAGGEALVRGVGTHDVIARGGGIVARSARPHTAVGGSARGAVIVVARRGVGGVGGHRGVHGAASGAGVRDGVAVDGASVGRAAHSGGGHGPGVASLAVSSALGAAEAVLVGTALAVVGAANSSSGVLVQDRAIKVVLAALASGAHTGSRGGSGRDRGRESQSSGLVGEVALRGGLAGSPAHGVGVPEALGVAQTRVAVRVVGARARVGGVRRRVGARNGGRKGEGPVGDFRGARIGRGRHRGGASARGTAGISVIASGMDPSEESQRVQETHLK